MSFYQKPVMHLLSGGIDSTVMLYSLLHQNCSVHCALFNYGQKHAARELAMARWHCRFLGVLFTEITLPTIRGSVLTDGGGTKIVPNRNAILLSIAISLAVNAKSEAVTYACNKDDAEDFPDCRVAFIASMNAASRAAETGVEVCAPFIGLTKKEIVAIGRFHNVDFSSTYSCYEGRGVPCGACDACKKREEALA